MDKLTLSELGIPESITLDCPIMDNKLQLSDSSNSNMIRVRASNETIVERDFGYIQLSHEPENIDLEFFKSNSALMILDHNSSDIRGSIGVIRNAELINKELILDIELSEREELKGVVRDIKLGILKSVSIGTNIVGLIEEVKLTEEEGSDVVYLLKHSPVEISLVVNPAIKSAQIIETLAEEVKEVTDPTQPVLNEGTELNQEVKEVPAVKEVTDIKPESIEILQSDSSKLNLTGDTNIMTTKVTAPAAVAPSKAELTAERGRVAELMKLSAMHNVDAGKAIEDGATVEQFQKVVLSAIETKGFEAMPPKEVGLSDKEVESFSFLKALTCAASGDWKHGGFELEAITAQAELEGKTLLSNEIIVPTDIKFASTIAANPSLVPTEKVRFIESIWDQTIVDKLGATRMSDVKGELQIDRETSNGTAYWVGENADLGENNYTADSFTLSEKTVGAYYNLSRSLLRQSSVNVEQRVYAHLRKAAALEIDKAILFGDGNSKPQGLVNLVDAGNIVDMSVTGWTWAKVVEYFDKLSNANLASDNMKWAMNNASISTLQQTLIDPSNTNSAFLMRSAADTLNSYEVLSSNIVPTTDAIFGDFSKLLVADFGSPTISVDQYTNHKNGGINVRIFAEIDSNIENTSAFSMYKV